MPQMNIARMALKGHPQPSELKRRLCQKRELSLLEGHLVVESCLLSDTRGLVPNTTGSSKTVSMTCCWKACALL